MITIKSFNKQCMDLVAEGYVVGGSYDELSAKNTSNHVLDIRRINHPDGSYVLLSKPKEEAKKPIDIDITSVLEFLEEEIQLATDCREDDEHINLLRKTETTIRRLAREAGYETKEL